MSTSQYLLGAAELAVIAAALGLGAYHLRALLVPAWTGALARLAEVVIGFSMLILVAEIVGVLGLFKPLPLVLGSVVVGAGYDPPRAPPGAPEAPKTPEVRASPLWSESESRPQSWWWSTGPTRRGRRSTRDVLPGHHLVPHVLLGPIRQTGHIGPLHFTDPLKLAVWFYPQNSELLHGVGIVALNTDFLSPLINLMWCALCLLAAWCVGRPYGIGGVTTLGAAVVLDSDMMVGSQAGQAPNDVMGLFFLMAALAFLIDGAASAHAIRVAATANGGTTTASPAPRRPGRWGWSRTCRSRATRVFWRPSELGRSSWRDSRQGWGSDEDHSAGDDRGVHDRGRDPRRAPALAAGARDLARRPS